jgi:hypothetical protein
VLTSVLSPPIAPVWRASHTARGAYLAALAWLNPNPPPPSAPPGQIRAGGHPPAPPGGQIPAGRDPPSPPPPPRWDAWWTEWEEAASLRARPFASRVSSDEGSRVWLTHPPAADGRSLLVCVVPCDHYHRRFCQGGGRGGSKVGGGNATSGGDGGWRAAGAGAQAGGGNGTGDWGVSAGKGGGEGGGIYDGDAAVWLAVWHPCVWRSEVRAMLSHNHSVHIALLILPLFHT